MPQVAIFVPQLVNRWPPSWRLCLADFLKHFPFSFLLAFGSLFQTKYNQKKL
jgi:hypothetical protein